MQIMTIAPVLLFLLGLTQAQQAPEAALASAESSFAITLHAGPAPACEAFGPIEEKRWSPLWEPDFISWTGSKTNPDTAVFTTAGHAGGKLLWVMTAHDCKSGLVQYVNVDPGNAVTVIEIRCTELSKNETRATVTSRKTALSPAGNDAVQSFADHFALQGPHWEQAINGYLAGAKAGQ
jgi:hypothetical protein